MSLVVTNGIGKHLVTLLVACSVFCCTGLPSLEASPLAARKADQRSSTKRASFFAHSLSTHNSGKERISATDIIRLASVIEFLQKRLSSEPSYASLDTRGRRNALITSLLMAGISIDRPELMPVGLSPELTAVYVLRGTLPRRRRITVDQALRFIEAMGQSNFGEPTAAPRPAARSAAQTVLEGVVDNAISSAREIAPADGASQLQKSRSE